MSDRAGGLLLTGASGFVGQSVLARWLARTDRPVTVLVRAANDDAAFARVAALLGEDAMRARRAPLYALAADVTDFDPDAVVARVAGAGAGPIDQVIHAAACVRFDQTLEEARAVNVAGTQRMLALARRLHADRPLRRYVQVSTAYVAGDITGGFGEGDRRIGQAFRNGYEESKIEAEELVVGAALDGLPVQVVRPSIVVGDRQSGWTAAFNVLYVPLRALGRRRRRRRARGGSRAVGRRAGRLRRRRVVGVVGRSRRRPHLPPDGRAPRDHCRRAGRPRVSIDGPQAAAAGQRGDVRDVLGGSAAGRVLAANLGDYLPYLDVRTRFDQRRRGAPRPARDPRDAGRRLPAPPDRLRPGATLGPGAARGGHPSLRLG